MPRDVFVVEFVVVLVKDSVLISISQRGRRDSSGIVAGTFDCNLYTGAM